MNIFVFILIVHVLVSLLILFGIVIGLLKVHKYMFVIALLLPFWGPLIVLILHFQIFFRADDAVEIGVEKLRVESELYKSVTVDEKRVASTTVPIEEALIVNSAEERRTIIMDVLNDNPKEYIQFLQKAGNNDDTEVVHYAVTAMVEISKENDYMLQQFEHDYEKNPEDEALLQRYTDFLWSCLSQNMMQGQVEVMNRDLFSSLMRKKIDNGNAKIGDYERLVMNELVSKNYSQAAIDLEEMGVYFPMEEQYLLLKVKYLACVGRGKEIAQLIEEIENSHIFLSAKAKGELAFWKP